MMQAVTLRADAKTMLAVLGVCVLAGWSVTIAGYFLPLLLGLSLFGGAAAAIIFFVMGAEAGLLAMAAIAAVFLMQRFDEDLAIPLGIFEIRGIYIISTALLIALAAVVLARRITDERPTGEASLFAGQWMSLWLAFLLSGFVTIAVNNAFHRDDLPRNIAGELLGQYAILFPMLFLPLALAGGMSSKSAMRGLHLMVGLGGLAGFILSMFGLLPGQVLAMLGWQAATTGTIDLVRGRLPLGHPNHVAAVINMLLPIALIYAFLGRRWRWRLFHLGCAFFMCVGVLFALSRGALLNLAIVTAITLAYVFLTREYRRWYTPVLAFTAVAAAIIVPLILFQKYDFSRFWSRGFYEDASVERRADSMRTAVQLWWDHPIVGASPNSLYRRMELRHDYTPRFGDSISPIFYYRGMPTAETPHNLYLMVPAEFGIVGAIFFFGMLLHMGITLLRARRFCGVERTDCHLMSAFLLSMLAILLSGMVEAVLFAGVRVNVLFWVMAAFMFVYTFHAIAHAEARQAHGRG